MCARAPGGRGTPRLQGKEGNFSLVTKAGNCAVPETQTSLVVVPICSLYTSSLSHNSLTLSLVPQLWRYVAPPKSKTLP